MLASELILALQKIINEHGDHPIGKMYLENARLTLPTLSTILIREPNEPRIGMLHNLVKVEHPHMFTKHGKPVIIEQQVDEQTLREFTYDFKRLIVI